jgi:hypothetical protein
MVRTTQPASTHRAASNDARSRGGGESRRVWLVVVASVVVIALVVVGGYVVWDRNWRTASSTNPPADCPTIAPAGHRRPLAMQGVDRVTLIGDSIMKQASCAVGTSLSGLGVTTYRHGVSGTGLLAGPGDWMATARQLMAAEHPDVVVAVFVGNYLQQAVDAAGKPIVADTPEFFAAWQQRAEELSKIVRDSGAQLYWVSPPPIALPPLNHASRLFEGYKRIEGDHTLDAGASLSGPDGKEVTDTITCGARRTVRTFDGTHLTPDGARIYGQSIAHELSADLGVLTSPKPC